MFGNVSSLRICCMTPCHPWAFWKIQDGVQDGRHIFLTESWPYIWPTKIQITNKNHRHQQFYLISLYLHHHLHNIVYKNIFFSLFLKTKNTIETGILMIINFKMHFVWKSLLYKRIVIYKFYFYLKHLFMKKKNWFEHLD